jgi:hypothetical protein
LRKPVAGMSADDVKRLRLLKQENTQLKKILAERDIEIAVIHLAGTGQHGRVNMPQAVKGVEVFWQASCFLGPVRSDRNLCP